MRYLGYMLGAGAVLAGTGRWLMQYRKRQQRASYAQPESLIIQPYQEVSVIRRADNHLEFRWPATAQFVNLHVGSTPQTIDRSTPIATVWHDDCVVMPDGLPYSRPYFAITMNDQPPQIVAERRLPLQGIANMRDIGGYLTVDGRRVQWGRVYRAGSLAGATASDLTYLDNLGLHLVCDLRSQEEVINEPDRLPKARTPRYLHLPVEADVNVSEQLRTLMFKPYHLPALVKEGYTRQILEANAGIIGDSLRHLADPTNLPAVVHCTAGKDRTGIVTALLLAALGVPDDTIIADYSLSNQDYPHLRRYIAGKFKQPHSFILGLTVDDLQPILSADPAYMRYTLDYIHEHYGTVENYLCQKARLDDTTLAALRDNLLEA